MVLVRPPEANNMQIAGKMDSDTFKRGYHFRWDGFVGKEGRYSSGTMNGNLMLEFYLFQTVN